MSKIIDQVAPELQPIARKIPSIPVRSAFGRKLLRFLFKITQHGVSHPKVTITRVNNGAIRLYQPKNKTTDAALFWIHGGGFIIGGAVQDDIICNYLSSTLGITVVSTEYRLAPEVPFPGPLDDCYASWRWLQDAAVDLSVNPKKVIISGQSAGGGLAACLVQRICDQDAVKPIAQWLCSPMLDDRTAIRQDLSDKEHIVWDNQKNYIGWSAYLGQVPGGDEVAAYAVAARKKDVRNVPPTLISAGDIELFFEEDKQYAERLQAAGVATTFMPLQGAFHGFETVAFSTGYTQKYLSQCIKWLRSYL